MTTEQLEKKIDNLNFRIDRAVDEKKSTESEIEELETKLDYIVEAIEILTAVLGATQQGVIRFIEETVTMALQCVVGEDYGFSVVYELKRNQPEVLFYIVKNGICYDPKFSVGIGIVDVCSFALRLVCYSLLSERTAPVLIFDEPFRCLGGDDENQNAGIMVKKLSDMLGVQIIIVSGKTTIAQFADKVFQVKIEGRVSQVHCM